MDVYRQAVRLAKLPRLLPDAACFSVDCTDDAMVLSSVPHASEKVFAIDPRLILYKWHAKADAELDQVPGGFKHPNSGWFLHQPHLFGFSTGLLWT